MSVKKQQAVMHPDGGGPVWVSPMHYDGELVGATIHADMFFTPTGVAAVHTIQSIVVTCDPGTPTRHIIVGRIDGSMWTSPLIPIGTTTLTQAQINAQGFINMEDIAEITAV